MTRPIHAARSDLTGDHRTDGLHCRCEPWQLADLNEPGRAVIVHRPMYELAESRAQSERLDPATGSASTPRSGDGRPGGGGSILGALVPGPLASLRHAGTSSTFLVTRPVLCRSKVQR